jgi:hypothetical protein
MSERVSNLFILLSARFPNCPQALSREKVNRFEIAHCSGDRRYALGGPRGEEEGPKAAQRSRKYPLLIRSLRS